MGKDLVRGACRGLVMNKNFHRTLWRGNIVSLTVSWAGSENMSGEEARTGALGRDFALARMLLRQKKDKLGDYKWADQI